MQETTEITYSFPYTEIAFVVENPEGKQEKQTTYCDQKLAELIKHV